MSLAERSDTGYSRADNLIDGILDVRLQSWREMTVYDEVAILYSKSGTNNKARFTFGNWNSEGVMIVERNSEQIDEPEHFHVDRTKGIMTLCDPWVVGEEIAATYNFNYFPWSHLYELLKFAVNIVNDSGLPRTTYRFNESPEDWDGIISEIVYMEALKKIRLDSTVWQSQVLLRFDPSDALSMISEEVSSSIDRVNSMVEGTKHLKKITLPTAYYYMAASGGVATGFDGTQSGRFHGMVLNRRFV